MVRDPNKKREILDHEFESVGVDIEPSGAGRTGAFSARKHRFYTPQGLQGGFPKRTKRVKYLLEKIAEIYHQTDKAVPYALIDQQGAKWSIDAGCLDAIGPNHQKMVNFNVRDGYIVAVEPTTKLIAQYGKNTSIATDIEELLKDKQLTKTQRKQLINARIGQGRFRRDVLALWRGKCAVTSCELDKVLRASHILPWRDADNSQRLDPENGLLLNANLDALFDAGLISFTDAGLLLTHLNEQDHTFLISSSMRLSKSPSKKMQAYLDRHRKHHNF